MRQIRGKRQWYPISVSSYATKRSVRAFFCRAFIPSIVFLWFTLYATSNFSSLLDAQSNDLLSSSSPSSIPALSNAFHFLSAYTTDSVVTSESSQSFIKAAEIRRIEVVDHLILVAGHSVMRMNRMRDAHYDEKSWYLLPYQTGQDFPRIIASHIRKGVDMARQDLSSLLVFSGGQTRKDVGPVSEAASYYYLADQNGWLNNIKDRVYLEEYARDSYENLLFSICRYREVTGNYPSRVIVIGFDFKSKRFTDLHRKAIRFPLRSFSYVGIKPEGNSFDHSRAVKGEEIVVDSFNNDMYGCGSKELLKKKEGRNPFVRFHPYFTSCPEIVDLLRWCGPDVYDGKYLPWYANSPMIKNGSKNEEKVNKRGGYITSQQRMDRGSIQRVARVKLPKKNMIN